MKTLKNSSVSIDDSENTIDIESLSKEYGYYLYNFVKKNIHNQEDIEDLVQLTYLEALKSKHNFKGNSKPKTWLFGIAHNLIKNHNRSTYNRPVHVDIEDTSILDIESYYDVEKVVSDQCRLDKFFVKFKTLKKDTQHVLNLIAFKNFSYIKVAQEMDVPVGTIRSRLSRARAYLNEG